MSKVHIVRATSKTSLERHLGTLVALMIRNGSYAPDMAAEINNVIPAILHEHILYFYDDYRRVCGFALWALLTPEVEYRVVKDQSLLLHESEWNEGDRFWIVSFASRYGMTGEIIRALKGQILPRHGERRGLRPRGEERTALVRVIRN